jgi:hypothetical protein
MPARMPAPPPKALNSMASMRNCISTWSRRAPVAPNTLFDRLCAELGLATPSTHHHKSGEQQPGLWTLPLEWTGTHGVAGPEARADFVQFFMNSRRASPGSSF